MYPLNLIQKVQILRFRREYQIRLCPEIHAAFKLLCGASGHKKVNEAVEKIMIRCIEAESLGLERKGPDRKASRLFQLEAIKRRLRKKEVEI